MHAVLASSSSGNAIAFINTSRPTPLALQRNSRASSLVTAATAGSAAAANHAPAVAGGAAHAHGTLAASFVSDIWFQEKSFQSMTVTAADTCAGHNSTPAASTAGIRRVGRKHPQQTQQQQQQQNQRQQQLQRNTPGARHITVRPSVSTVDSSGAPHRSLPRTASELQPLVEDVIAAADAAAAVRGHIHQQRHQSQRSMRDLADSPMTASSDWNRADKDPADLATLLTSAADKLYKQRLRELHALMSPEALQQLQLTPQQYSSLQVVLSDLQDLQASFEEEGSEADQLTEVEAEVVHQLTGGTQVMPDDFESYLAAFLPDDAEPEDVQLLMTQLDPHVLSDIRSVYGDLKRFEQTSMDVQEAQQQYVLLSQKISSVTQRVEAYLASASDDSGSTSGGVPMPHNTIATTQLDQQTPNDSQHPQQVNSGSSFQKIAAASHSTSCGSSSSSSSSRNSSSSSSSGSNSKRSWGSWARQPRASTHGRMSAVDSSSSSGDSMSGATGCCKQQEDTAAAVLPPRENDVKSHNPQQLQVHAAEHMEQQQPHPVEASQQQQQEGQDRTAVEAARPGSLRTRRRRPVIRRPSSGAAA